MQYCYFMLIYFFKYFVLGILVAVILKTSLANIYLLTGINLTQFILPGIHYTYILYTLVIK